VLVYIVVCAAPPARDVGELVGLGRERGWDVAIVASPDALAFIDPAELELSTGYTVRSEWRGPDEPASVPDADAVVVAPATFNTLNKWVAGIADTVASATLCEYLGRSVPMVVAPCVSPDLARHPTFRTNLGVLAGWGSGCCSMTRRRPPAGWRPGRGSPPSWSPRSPRGRPGRGADPPHRSRRPRGRGADGRIRTGDLSLTRRKLCPGGGWCSIWS
jgi:hypothetical protein